MNVPVDQRPIVLAVFVLTYVGLAVGRIPGLRLNRAGIALLGAIAMMIVSGNSTGVTVSSINWPTIALLFGFFVISAQLRLSGFYHQVADAISQRLDHPAGFLIFLIAVTAGLSAFLNNDVVCYVLTPVVGAALIRKQLNPVPYLIAMAVAANIGAGATLIGNAQNMMIGQLTGLGFLGYMLWSVVPVLFGLAITFLVARLELRAGVAQLEPPEDEGASESVYLFDRYHAAKGLAVLGIVIALFFTSLPKEVVVLVAAGIHLMSHKFRTQELLSLVDWQLLLLFVSLFVVSGTFQATGYESQLVQWLEGRGMDPSQTGNEVALTAGLTALIGNAPAVMLLVKLVPIARASTACVMGVANNFGGNAILTASVANLIVVQQARRAGIVISFGSFARMGLPITLISLGGLYAWALLIGG